jgi:hypothetical protein
MNTMTSDEGPQAPRRWAHENCMRQANELQKTLDRLQKEINELIEVIMQIPNDPTIQAPALLR